MLFLGYIIARTIKCILAIRRAVTKHTLLGFIILSISVVEPTSFIENDKEFLSDILLWRTCETFSLLPDIAKGMNY